MISPASLIASSSRIEVGQSANAARASPRSTRACSSARARGCLPRTRCADRAAGPGCRAAGRAPRPGGWTRRARPADPAGTVSGLAASRHQRPSRYSPNRCGASGSGRAAGRHLEARARSPSSSRRAPARPEVLHQPVVGEDLQRLVREDDREEPVRLAPALPLPAAQRLHPRGGRAPVVPVGDVERRPARRAPPRWPRSPRAGGPTPCARRRRRW